MIIDDLQIITGIDIPVEKLGLTIKQPAIKDIAILGEQKYFIALSLFLLDKEQLKLKGEVSEWEIFNEVLKAEMPNVKNPRVLLGNFLQLFFPQKVVIGPRSIIVSTQPEMTNIEGGNFAILQDVIGQIGGKTLLDSSKEDEFKPLNARAAAIAEKIKKGRENLAKAKGLDGSEGFLAKYVRALSIVTANSVKEITELTLLQLKKIMATYMAYEAYDLDVKSRLAGAQSKEKLVHWLTKSSEKKGD